MSWGWFATLALMATPSAAACDDGPFVVFFAPGSSRIGDAAEPVLDRAGRPCGKNGVAVEGNIDAAEGGALGLARARSVRRALIARGIDPATIAVTDNGNRRARVMAETADAQNRYVLIARRPVR